MDNCCWNWYPVNVRLQFTHILNTELKRFVNISSSFVNRMYILMALTESIIYCIYSCGASVWIYPRLVEDIGIDLVRITPWTPPYLYTYSMDNMHAHITRQFSAYKRIGRLIHHFFYYFITKKIIPDSLFNYYNYYYY